jgi:hypothetical protein
MHGGYNVPGILFQLDEFVSSQRFSTNKSISKKLQAFQGAINSRIAEEQARQKATAAAPVSRSASASRRSLSRTDSPSSRPRKSKPKEYDGSTRGADPSEFETNFVIDDEAEEPSRVGTPATMDEKEPLKAEDGVPAQAGSVNGTEKGGDVEESPSIELPPDVRAKLRKLEKLESRYQGRL